MSDILFEYDILEMWVLNVVTQGGYRVVKCGCKGYTRFLIYLNMALMPQ